MLDFFRNPLFIGLFDFDLFFQVHLLPISFFPFPISHPFDQSPFLNCFHFENERKIFFLTWEGICDKYASCILIISCNYKFTCGKFITMENVVVTVWNLIKERSSVRRVSIELGMDRSSLYRSLKKGTNPRIDTIQKFLDHLGYRLQVVKTKKKAKKSQSAKRVKSRRVDIKWARTTAV